MELYLPDSDERLTGEVRGFGKTVVVEFKGRIAIHAHVHAYSRPKDSIKQCTQYTSVRNAPILSDYSSQ